jgi:MtaA/CmuA family methyltransferase
MNGFERYTATLKGRAADFLPRTPILMQFAAEYIVSNYGEFAGKWQVLTKANIRCAEDFGIDQLSCISDPYRETQGFGGKIDYVKDGVPRCSHPLKESKDLSVLHKPDPLKSERMLDRIQAARFYNENFAGEYSILGWVEGPAAEAADIRDVMNFLMDVMDDEAYICELMDISLDAGIEFAKAQIEAGCDTIGIGDAIASQMSPDIYERLIQPREKKLVKAIQEAGGYAKLHICGDITHLLEGIVDLGVDILDVDHLVDIAKVRKALGSGIAIAGNIDPAGGVLNGTPESIREELLRTYDMIGNPYIVNAGCEIPAGTPIENLKALCEPIAYNS